MADQTVGGHTDEIGSSQRVERVNITQLGQMLRERRGELSIRQAAAEARVSFSTFSRVEGGAQPDLATFTALCAWLGVSPARFLNAGSTRELSPLDEAVSHLQSDPRLSQDAAGKLSAFLRDMYEALADQVDSSRPVVACHLRATSVMRPGVPDRLAGLLQDMHDALDNQVQAGTL